MKLISEEQIKKEIEQRYPCFDPEEDGHILELEEAIAQAQLAQDQKSTEGWKSPAEVEQIRTEAYQKGMVQAKILDRNLLTKEEIDELNKGVDEFLDSIRKQGIKEVVERIKHNRGWYDNGNPGHGRWTIDGKAWQSWLEAWGLGKEGK